MSLLELKISTGVLLKEGAWSTSEVARFGSSFWSELRNHVSIPEVLSFHGAQCHSLPPETICVLNHTEFMETHWKENRKKSRGAYF